MTSPATNRLLIFFFYDAEGIADDYVPYLLNAFRPFVSRILFVSNGALDRASEEKVRACCDEILVRPNVGFDVWAYKEAMEKVGYEELASYDEVLLANHTCYGPIFPFSEMFDEMESRTVDFWGISVHKALTPNPMTGIGTMHAHIQSHFIAVRKRLLASPEFRDYWQSMVPITSYEESVLKHESRFTHHFASLGYSHGAFIDPDDFSTPYPIFMEVGRSIDLRSPILKRRLFFHDHPFQQSTGTDLPGALERLAEASDYDPALIWKNIAREAKPRTLLANSGHLRILDDDSANVPPSPLRLAVILHVRDLRSIEFFVGTVAMFPAAADLLVTTESEECLQALGLALEAESRRRLVKISVTSPDNDLGMTSLLLGNREVLVADKYDLVCRLQDDFTKFDYRVPEAYRQHVMACTVRSEGYVRNVIALFTNMPWLGVAFAPFKHVAGVGWPNYRYYADSILSVLGLRSRVDNVPLAPQLGVFWFRPQALQKLLTHTWRADELKGHRGGGVLNALPAVAMAAGFTVMEIMSRTAAERSYVQLDYLVTELEPNKTVRQAAGELLKAMKVAFRLRFPRLFVSLRPLYRTITPLVRRLMR